MKILLNIDKIYLEIQNGKIGFVVDISMYSLVVIRAIF
jgi:hypothetical protein